jgi:antitoxin CptB
MTPESTADGSPIEGHLSSVSGDQPAPEDWIRRIRWRARRGLLENDLLISRYLEHRGDALTRDDHDGLAEILELSDNDLLDVLVDRKQADEVVVSPGARRVVMDIKGT